MSLTRPARAKFSEPTDDGRTAPVSPWGVLIQITLDHSSPPVGTVTVLGGAAATPFQGWLDLMGALVEFVGAPSNEEDELGAGAQAQLGEDV